MSLVSLAGTIVRSCCCCCLGKSGMECYILWLLLICGTCLLCLGGCGLGDGLFVLGHRLCGWCLANGHRGRVGLGLCLEFLFGCTIYEGIVANIVTGDFFGYLLEGLTAKGIAGGGRGGCGGDFIATTKTTTASAAT